MGPFCIPSINDVSNEININMITCGGQASLPLLNVISKFSKKLSYIEVVSQIASDSAGLSTRINIDNYINTTESAIKQFTGTPECKVILNLNSAVPQVDMQTTMFVRADDFDYSNLVAIGIKNPAGDIVFDEQNILSNSVFVTDKDHTFAVSIKAAPVNTAPIVHDIADINIDELASVQIHVHAFDDEQTALEFTWSIPSEISYTGSDANIVITAPSVELNTDYPVSVSVSDGMLTTTKSFVISVNNLAVDPTEPVWSSTKAYSAGDKVVFEGKIYEAKWWNKNQKPNNSNAWKLATPTDGGVPVWSVQNDYAGGTVVTHNAILYKAKWWTKGEEPGVSAVWQKL